MMGNRPIGAEEQDLFSARPVFVPFYSFALADGTTRHVYGGVSLSALPLRVLYASIMTDCLWSVGLL